MRGGPVLFAGVTPGRGDGSAVLSRGRARPPQRGGGFNLGCGGPPCRSLLDRSGVIIQSLAPTVELLRVRKSYGSFTAVDDLSLEIPPAHIFGLLGPNGAGKTSTIRMMIGITAPDSGCVRIFGEPFRRRVLRRGRVNSHVRDVVFAVVLRRDGDAIGHGREERAHYRGVAVRGERAGTDDRQDSRHRQRRPDADRGMVCDGGARRVAEPVPPHRDDGARRGSVADCLFRRLLSLWFV